MPCRTDTRGDGSLILLSKISLGISELMHECDDAYGPFVVVNRVENAVTLNEALSHLFAYGLADIKVDAKKPEVVRDEGQFFLRTR